MPKRLAIVLTSLMLNSCYSADLRQDQRYSVHAENLLAAHTNAVEPGSLNLPERRLYCVVDEGVRPSEALAYHYKHYRVPSEHRETVLDDQEIPDGALGLMTVGPGGSSLVMVRKAAVPAIQYKSGCGDSSRTALVWSRDHFVMTEEG